MASRVAELSVGVETAATEPLQATDDEDSAVATAALVSRPWHCHGGVRSVVQPGVSAAGLDL
jgi:hypothetical protein